MELGDKELKNLAIYLHDKYCRWNHADGCSWHYAIDRETGNHDWSDYAHKEYLDKARDLVDWMNRHKSPPVSIEHLE